MQIILRASAVFFFLWALTRGLGKRELAQLSAFELVLLIMLGDLVQQGVTQEDYSVTGAMLATGTIAFWVLLFAYVAFRRPDARPALEGVPVLIVRDGQPLEEAMRIERVSLEEVLEAARQQGIADLGKVTVALLEPDGKFSFITEGKRQHPPEDKDLR